MVNNSVEDEYGLVRLATAPNSFIAHIWQQALEQEGIRAKVLGDDLEAGLGDLQGFSAEVWVETADLARAQEMLRQHQDRTETTPSPEQTDGPGS